VAADTQYVLPATTNKQVAVGIVLGAGITKDGRPFKELQARLDVAAEALNRGTVKKLILSGDNSRKTYDEPTAMITYLTNTKHVDPSKLQPDYAGRSTYESCERAASIFNVKQTILFSAPSHLPRAIFLCRHFGIETYGISSGLDGNNAGRREPLARVKALYNVYVHGEPTILGKSITVN
jgi:vancomycin permeability regulator SanA